MVEEPGALIQRFIRAGVVGMQDNDAKLAQHMAHHSVPLFLYDSDAGVVYGVFVSG